MASEDEPKFKAKIIKIFGPEGLPLYPELLKKYEEQADVERVAEADSGADQIETSASDADATVGRSLKQHLADVSERGAGFRLWSSFLVFAVVIGAFVGIFQSAKFVTKGGLTMDTLMASLLTLLVHVFVIAAIIGMIYFLFYLILDNPDLIERLLRVSAFAAGLLIYVGAKALGITVPELMSSALRVTNPLAFGVVIPALAGIFVAWFCLRLMKKDTNVAERGLVLFSTFVFTMFADSYAITATKSTPSNLSLALPNITFVVGVILYTIFTYKTGEDALEQQLVQRYGQKDELPWYEQLKKARDVFHRPPRHGKDKPEEKHNETNVP